MVVVRAHVRQIFICADTTKETGGRKKSPQLCSCQCICSVSGSLSSLSFSKAIYEQLLLPLPASLYFPSEEESDAQEGKMWMPMDHCSRPYNRKTIKKKCVARETELSST